MTIKMLSLLQQDEPAVITKPITPRNPLPQNNLNQNQPIRNKVNHRQMRLNRAKRAMFQFHSTPPITQQHQSVGPPIIFQSHHHYHLVDVVISGQCHNNNNRFKLTHMNIMYHCNPIHTIPLPPINKINRINPSTNKIPTIATPPPQSTPPISYPVPPPHPTITLPQLVMVGVVGCSMVATVWITKAKSSPTTQCPIPTHPSSPQPPPPPPS